MWNILALSACSWIYFEKIAKIPVEVEYASEFRYREPVIGKEDIVLAISQSEADLCNKLAKEKGAFIYGICNVINSSITRESDTGSYTHAGPEIGVASTKHLPLKWPFYI